MGLAVFADALARSGAGHRAHHLCRRSHHGTRHTEIFGNKLQRENLRRARNTPAIS